MKPRVLHVITVYNGRAFVPRAIRSAMQMDRTGAEIDVLVLDDASPEPGWSDELQAICSKSGAYYYLTPRNLGIPRNVSLGLRTAIEKGYDYVTINNSDVIFPNNLINVLLNCCCAEKVGSVTAWSNNVSIYSLPNSDPDSNLASQTTVDFISEVLEASHASTVVDIPAGISFCIMMPVSAVKAIGLMDPIFGRGYCEETDWSIRSLQMGYRVCLAPGAFVYHQGRGSNLAAGLVSGAHSTVPENEVIIDKRYPNFRRTVADFQSTGRMEALQERAIADIIRHAAKRFGYAIIPEWNQSNLKLDASAVRVEIRPSEALPHLRIAYAGFEERKPILDNEFVDQIISRFGPETLVYNGFNGLSGNESDRILEASYPRSVW